MTEQEFYDEMMGEAMTELLEEDNRRKKEKTVLKKNLKGLLNVKGFFEWLDEMDNWNFLGYVKIHPTDRKMYGYPKGECVTHVGGSKLYQKTHFDEVRGMDFYYVNQRTGYHCDDYYGELIVPLNDGRYMEIEYSC